MSEVRWPLEKLDRIGQLPCVIGFSGDVGRAQRARRSLTEAHLVPNAFRRVDTVLNVMDKCLAPHYQEIMDRWGKPPASIFQVTLWGLAGLWAEGEPRILEFEMSGTSSFHEYFHAIGSASKTAYAIYRTLGGRELIGLEERKALVVLLRILRTSVDVESFGVSDPIVTWVVTGDRVRKVSLPEQDTHMQAIDQLEQRQRAILFQD